MGSINWRLLYWSQTRACCVFHYIKIVFIKQRATFFIRDKCHWYSPFMFPSEWAKLVLRVKIWLRCCKLPSILIAKTIYSQPARTGQLHADLIGEPNQCEEWKRTWRYPKRRFTATLSTTKSDPGQKETSWVSSKGSQGWVWSWQAWTAHWWKW